MMTFAAHLVAKRYLISSDLFQIIYKLIIKINFVINKM